MTITRAGAVSYRGVTTGQATVPITTVGVGNLLVLFVNVTSAGTLAATGISGGGVSSWATAGALFSTPTVAGNSQLWWGVVTTAGTANATMTFSAAIGTTSVIQTYTEYQSSVGGTWGFDKGSGVQSTVTTTTMTWPSLTPASGSELYVGYEVDNVATVGSGTTSGCTYVANSAPALWVFDPTTTTALAPVATFTSPGGLYSALGALFTVSGAVATNSDFFMVF